MQYLKEHKHLITLLVAIATALYQHLVMPIPGLEPEVWDAMLGLGATYSTIKVSKKIGILPSLKAAKDLNTLRKAFNDTAAEDAADNSTNSKVGS